MEVNGELYAPTPLLLEKEYPGPITSEAGWGPETMWTLWNRKTNLPLRESNPGCPVRSPSLYELIYLHRKYKAFSVMLARPQAADGGDGLHVWKIVTNY
jgi:hypothetical protein